MTDYDCWKDDIEPVDAQHVLKVMGANVENVKKLLLAKKIITCIFSRSELMHPFLTAKFRPLISINIIIFQPCH